MTGTEKLSCSLIQVAPITGSTEKSAAPDQEPLDPRIWYETHGRKVLESLVADLASRRHHSLTLKEDGNICVRPVDGGTETAQGAFPTFPEKVYWPRLVEVLKQNGLAATAKDTVSSWPGERRSGMKQGRTIQEVARGIHSLGIPLSLSMEWTTIRGPLRPRN